jgi:hypothetical protein
VVSVVPMVGIATPGGWAVVGASISRHGKSPRGPKSGAHRVGKSSRVGADGDGVIGPGGWSMLIGAVADGTSGVNAHWKWAGWTPSNGAVVDGRTIALFGTGTVADAE